MFEWGGMNSEALGDLLMGEVKKVLMEVAWREECGVSQDDRAHKQ